MTKKKPYFTAEKIKTYLGIITISGALLLGLFTFAWSRVRDVATQEVKKEINIVKECYKNDQRILIDEIGLLKFYIIESIPMHKRRNAEQNYREFKGRKK